nr:MAG TPA: tail tape measure protein [Caudoviricetes sp.]
MVSAASMFRKSGFNDSDAAMLAKVAASYQNVADTAVSAEDAAASIVSQIRAFGEDASFATHVIDAYNEVANNFSVGTNDLSQAMEIAASGMATYGNSFEQVIGLVTSGTEIMQGRSSQVARGLSTIAARIVKNQDALAEYGITVGNVDGSLKSTFDVLSELKPKWDSMTDAQRTALGDTIAGQNQYKVLASVMQNFGHAADATKTALESAGSAAQENSKYMESLEAKQQALKAEFEDFANRVLSKDLVGGFINAGTAMLNFANNDVGAAITRIGVLSTGVTGLVGIVGQTVGKIAEVGLQLKNLGVGGDSFLGMLASGKIALIVGGTVAAITALVEVIKAVNQAIENNKFENLVASMDEANQELEDTKTGYEETKKKLDELNNTPYDGNEAELQAEREQLEKQIEAYEKLIELRQTDTVEAARKVATGGKQVTGATVSGLGTDEFGNKTLTTWSNNLSLTDEQANALKGTFESVEDAINAAFEALHEYVDSTTYDAYLEAASLGNWSEAAEIAKNALNGLGVTITETKQKTIDWAQSQGQSLANWSKYTQDVITSSDSATRQVGELVTSTEDYYNALKILADNGENLDQWQLDFINNWEALNGIVQNTDLSGAANDVQELGIAAEESASKLDTYIAALDQYRGANENAADASGVLVDSLFDTNGQLTEAGKQALSTSGSMASMAQSFIQAQQEQAQIDFSALILAISKVGEAAMVTTSQLASMMAMAGVDISGGETNAVASLRHQYYVETGKGSTSGSKMVDGKVEMQNTKEFTDWAASYIQKQAQEKFEKQQKEYADKLKQIGTFVPSGGGGGGSSSTKKDQEEVKAQTINTIEELREYLTDESTRLKLIDPDISKSDLQDTLSEVATIYQSYQDYLSQLKQQGFDETSEQYKDAETEFAQFVEVVKNLLMSLLSDGKYSIDEIMDYVEKNCGNLSDMISGMLGTVKDKVTSTVSSVAGSIHQAFASGDANSAIAAIENAWTMIRQMGASIEEQYDAAVAKAVENAAAEKGIAEEVADEYDRQNQLLDDKIALEEKLEALEKAKQRRMLVYSEGRFQYMQDADAISSAQKDYQETYRDAEQRQIKEIMDMIGDESSEFFKKYFGEGGSGDVYGYTGALKEHLMDYARGQLGGTVLEGVSDEQLNSIFGEAMKPGEAYKQILIAYNEVQAAREERREREAELKKQIREENVRHYGVDTDFGEKIKNAQSQAEVGYWTQLRDTKQQMIKEYREAYGDEAASKYFGTDVSKQDEWKSNRDLYKESYESGSKAWWFDKEQLHRQNYVDPRDEWTEENPELTQAQYNAATAVDMEGFGDQRLYDRIFSGAITKDEIQDLYDKSKSDISKGYLLNLGNEMHKAGYPGYAKGTRSANRGLSLVGENGPELRVLNHGDGILPNNITDNLWRWGSMTPSDMLTSLAQKAQSWAQTLNISNVTLPNVRDAQSFVSGLRELAQQYVTRRS